MRRAVNEPISDRVAARHHDDWNSLSLLLGGTDCFRRGQDKDVNLEVNQLGNEFPRSPPLASSTAIFDDNVFAIDVTKSLQPLPQRFNVGSWVRAVAGAGNLSDPRDFRWLLRRAEKQSGKSRA